MKLPKSYEPAQYEADIYALWEREGAFLPQSRGSDKTYSVVLPPPNANGDLHIGHALTVAIEDALVRYYRLQGRAALFLPGADHAGFETWVVYEKKLAEQGKSRFDFSREELYGQVWDFVQANKHNFEAQLRGLGASLDWSRFTFSLDNKVVARSYETFKKLWDEGLIYRGDRIVNYCTFHGTSFSDIEVVHEQEKTKLWHIAYPLTDGSGEVVIATTRPETKLGQAALMVNPKDTRYKHLIGKEVNQPLVPNKPIKIIADDYVDMKFGTGVVTVTPGHDTNDFEVAQRHDLPVTELITTEGKLSVNVPEPFRGLTINEARNTVAEALQKTGYIRKVEDYTHSVGKCYRCGTIIEPLVRDQWFVKMRPLADRAIKALETGKITFYPASKLGQTLRYLKEVKDWNISRQIAWGIPFPAFVNVNDPSDWIFDERVKEETIEVNGKTYRRDPDVFDTWFSSGHWPIVTLDGTNGDNFKRFYPLNMMETGFDILYPWVTRMIMLGLYVTGEVPFKDVYLHGLVTDEKAQKMSKSKGNVVNPMDIIGQYGSDALRMGLLTGQTVGNNQPFTHDKVIGARNFCNKLWNIARFAEEQIGQQSHLRANPEPKSPADHWILQRQNEAAAAVAKALEAYRIGEAYELVYHFIWHDFADWYVEASKADLNTSVMAHVLDSSLKLAHPFAPFVTETIWQTLAWEQGTMLATQSWPKKTASDAASAKQFERLMEVVTEVRRITGILGVQKPNLYYQNAPEIALQADLIKRLARLGNISEATGNHKGLRLTETALEVWLDIDRSTAQNYLQKLKNQLEERRTAIANLEKRLSNRDYVKNAPPVVVSQSHTQLTEENRLLAALNQEIASFEKASEDI